MKKILLFDFDGTIADSFDAVLECINDNAEYYGYKKILHKELLKNKNIHDIFREMEFSIFKIPFVVSAIRKEMRSKLGTIQPFPGIPEILFQLHLQNIPLGIISSNSQENIEIFLRKHNLNIFTYVHGETNIFGKNTVIKNFLTKHSLDPIYVTYIGDEVRDIEAAQANKIKSAAVTWGFNTLEKLEELKPNYIINTPEELLILSTDLP